MTPHEVTHNEIFRTFVSSFKFNSSVLKLLTWKINQSQLGHLNIGNY